MHCHYSFHRASRCEYTSQLLSTYKPRLLYFQNMFCKQQQIMQIKYMRTFILHYGPQAPHAIDAAMHICGGCFLLVYLLYFPSAHTHTDIYIYHPYHPGPFLLPPKTAPPVKLKGRTQESILQRCNCIYFVELAMSLEEQRF